MCLGTTYLEFCYYDLWSITSIFQKTAVVNGNNILKIQLQRATDPV